MAKKSPPPEEIWTYEEAAAVMKISVKALSRLCDKRGIEYRIVAGKRRFDPVTVRLWLAGELKATLEDLTT